MDLVTTARRLESRIARRMEDAAHRAMGHAGRDPLAVIHAVVDAVAQELQPVGRGRRVFPYNKVVVTVAAAAPAQRARFEAVLDCGPTLRDRMVERLRGTGAELGEIEVRIGYAPEPQAHWSEPDFHVELSRVAMPVEVSLPPRVEQSKIVLTVVHGDAAQPGYSLAQARIDIGRGAEVRNARSQLVRANHVAFIETTEAVNASVSRRHAHIAWDPESRTYRIHDDGSTHGTQVLREGTTIAVRTGSRGTRLQDGDEIVLGEARVQVSLVSR